MQQSTQCFQLRERGGIKPPQIIVVSTLEFLPISFLVLLLFSHSTFWDTRQDSALTEYIYLINSSAVETDFISFDSIQRPGQVQSVLQLCCTVWCPNQSTLKRKTWQRSLFTAGMDTAYLMQGYDKAIPNYFFGVGAFGYEL